MKIDSVRLWFFKNALTIFLIAPENGSLRAHWIESTSLSSFLPDLRQGKVSCLIIKRKFFTEFDVYSSGHFILRYILRFGSFNYVVMTLVGQSLQDLRKKGFGEHMSLGTAVSCAIQALEALEDLHSIGYLHRWEFPRIKSCFTTPFDKMQYSDLKPPILH